MKDVLIFLLIKAEGDLHFLYILLLQFSLFFFLHPLLFISYLHKLNVIFNYQLPVECIKHKQKNKKYLYYFFFNIHFFARRKSKSSRSNAFFICSMFFIVLDGRYWFHEKKSSNSRLMNPIEHYKQSHLYVCVFIGLYVYM